MKKCRIVHINDGNHRELANGNRFFAEHNPQTEEKLNQLLALGYEVKHVVSQYSPSIQGETGNYMFYKSGYTFYLEKEFADGDMNDDEEFEEIFFSDNDAEYPDNYEAGSEEYENFVKVLNQLSADDLGHLLDELDTDEDFDETDFED